MIMQLRILIEYSSAKLYEIKKNILFVYLRLIPFEYSILDMTLANVFALWMNFQTKCLSLKKSVHRNESDEFINKTRITDKIIRRTSVEKMWNVFSSVQWYFDTLRNAPKHSTWIWICFVIVDCAGPHKSHKFAFAKITKGAQSLAAIQIIIHFSTLLWALGNTRAARICYTLSSPEWGKILLISCVTKCNKMRNVYNLSVCSN